MTALALREPFKISRWDRFLLNVFPRWGVRRLHARAAATSMVRHFDAAGGGRRTSGWRSHSTDADTANGPALAKMRDLGRDIIRNNGWARRGRKAIGNNTVGKGLTPKVEAPRQVKTRAKRLWDGWAKSTRCDVNGRLNFAGLQLLVMSTVVTSGEALVVRRTARPTDGARIPLQLQVLEPDYIDTSRDFRVGQDGNRVKEGIEYDAAGDRVAYYLFPEHPGSGSFSLFTRGLQSQRVPAEDVIHVYEVERPGQNRGVSWLASAITRLQDFDDFEDAELLQQKIAACFGAFVKDIEGGGNALGQKDATDTTLETIQPGSIQYLLPGQDVEFATPPAPRTDQGFSQRSLRRIAASLNVTYEEMTGDFSQVNFSSARMARISHFASVWTWQHHMLIPQLCDTVWAWFMDLAVRSALLRSFVPATWATPPIPMLEPEKEGLALNRLVRGGFLTWGEAIAERGRDPETQLAEIAEWNEKFDEHGVIVDADPRRTNNSGQLQSANATAEGDKPPVEDGDEEE